MMPVDTTIEIYSIKKIHQHVHTSDLETMTFPVLINQNKSVYMVEDAIIDSYLMDEESLMKIPVSITSIEQSHRQSFQGHTFFAYAIKASINVTTDDFHMQLNDAVLVLSYQDEVTLKVPIGSFDYAFKSLESNHVHVYDRINLSHTIGEVPTSMGMVISIENKTMHPINIHSIKLLTNRIIPNMQAIKTLKILDPNASKLTNYFDETIVHLPNASPISPLIIEPYEESIYAIPFSYLDQTYIMHQYPIIITYELEGILHEATFDDFTFIKTNPFINAEEGIYESATIYKD